MVEPPSLLCYLIVERVSEYLLRGFIDGFEYEELFDSFLTIVKFFKVDANRSFTLFFYCYRISSSLSSSYESKSS